MNRIIFEEKKGLRGRKMAATEAASEAAEKEVIDTMIISRDPRSEAAYLLIQSNVHIAAPWCPLFINATQQQQQYHADINSNGNIPWKPKFENDDYQVSRLISIDIGRLISSSTLANIDSFLFIIIIIKVCPNLDFFFFWFFRSNIYSF